MDLSKYVGSISRSKDPPNQGMNLTAYSKLFRSCCAIFAPKKLAVICRLSQR